MIQIDFTKGKIDAFSAVGEGWDVIRDQYALFVLINLIVIIVSSIPYLGFICQGPITCGYYFCVLAKMRGEQISLGMLFKGFSLFFPACVIGILSTIPLRLQSYPGLFFAIFSGIPPLIGILLALGLYVLIAAWALGMSFGYALLVDYKLKVGEAISLSFKAARMNALGLIRLGGVMTVIIVILLILPIAMLMVGEISLALLSLVIFALVMILVTPLFGAAGAVVYKQVFSGDTTIEKTGSIFNL